MKLTPQHPALSNARTIHQKKVMSPVGKKVLKPARDNKKLGGVVTKGRYRGFPMFSLTLEERASCNPLCIHWDDCYGNNMGFAHRFEHGPELLSALRLELNELSRVYRTGFLVRLHVLGDFYSTEYVDFWRGMLTLYTQLHVFGYTGWQKGTPIGDAIDHMNKRPRWQIRFSNNSGELNTASSIPTKNAIQCPQQTGKTANCGTCSFCWETDKPVYFKAH